MHIFIIQVMHGTHVNCGIKPTDLYLSVANYVSLGAIYIYLRRRHTESDSNQTCIRVCFNEHMYKPRIKQATDMLNGGRLK